MIDFTAEGFDDYTTWQTKDRRTLKKVNQMVMDIMRNGTTGIGHPEPLKHDVSGKWSRTIDDKNRLTYIIHDDGKIEIFGCKGHYGDK